MEQAVAVILLGGNSTRYRAEKAFEQVDGKPLFLASSRPFALSGLVSRLVYVVRKDLIGEVAEILKADDPGLPYDLVLGGASREESAKQGLSLLWPDTLALVHDGCRPYLTDELVKRIVVASKKGAVVIPAIHPREAVYSLEEKRYLGKKDVYLVETPEALYRDDFLAAYRKLGAKAVDFPDEGSLMLAAGYEPVFVEGEPNNAKVTFPGDLR